MGKALFVVLALLALAPVVVADPIPESDTSAQQFYGTPATQNPIFGIRQAPRHPFMAPNQRSNIHTDAWQTDTNRLPGPLGREMTRVSASHFADCGSVTFDSRGRIVTVCVGLQGPGQGGAGLYLLDPKTLDQIAKYDLPGRQPGTTNPGGLFTDFSGGGYFYLDNKDRAVVPTTSHHIFIVGETADGKGFEMQKDLDLSSQIPDNDKIISALPDWKGLIWFATTQGLIGTVGQSGAIQYLDLREKIGNSFAVDETGGVYIVTDAALYRFTDDEFGAIRQTWRTPYANDGKSKPGQTEIGSGTTPTITSRGFVAITDNDDPIHINVLRRKDGALVCRAPVFEKGASNTDQSLIGAGGSFIAENNYGYSGPTAVEQGGTTTPGLERVDVDAKGRCHKVWHSDEIAPSVVPKLSLANGLVYTYTKPGGDRSDPWYLTALDFRSGKTVFKYKAGQGLGFNNNYAPVTIGPDGTAYVGVLGGIVGMRDAKPPPRIKFGPGGRRPVSRPELKLRLRYRHGGSCSRRRVTASVVGADAGLVRRVTFRLGRRAARMDRRAPFRRRFRVGSARFGAQVHARVLLVDGRRLRLKRALQPCSRGVAG